MNGRATVTRMFDSIDSIVDPIRCRFLPLVVWACDNCEVLSIGVGELKPPY